MGQAKRRGTYEERKQEALIRNENEREKQLKARMEYEKSPEGQKRRVKVMQFLDLIVRLFGINNTIYNRKIK